MNILIPGTNTRVISGERENHREGLAHIPTSGKSTLGFHLHRQAVAAPQFQVVHTGDSHSNTVFIPKSKRRNQKPLHFENKIRLNKLSFVSHRTFPTVYDTLFCNEFQVSVMTGLHQLTKKEVCVKNRQSLQTIANSDFCSNDGKFMVKLRGILLAFKYNEICFDCILKKILYS